MTLLSLDAIRIDGGTQSRATCSDETIADYAEHLSELPPAVVFFDGTDHWMADGFHRFHAHRKAGRAKMKCEIRKGDIHDARLFSASANNAHGLRRSNADKRACVVLLLKDDKWSKSSDRWIAEHAGVSDKTVKVVRDELRISAVEPRTGKDGKTRNQPKAKAPKSEASTVCPSCKAPWNDDAESCAACGHGSVNGAAAEPPSSPRSTSVVDDKREFNASVEASNLYDATIEILARWPDGVSYQPLLDVIGQLRKKIEKLENRLLEAS